MLILDWFASTLVAISIVVLVVAWRLYRRDGIGHKILLSLYVAALCVVYAAALWVENKERYSLSETGMAVIAVIIFSVNVAKVIMIVRDCKVNRDNRDMQE